MGANIEPKEKMIGDVAYQVRPLPPDQALRTGCKLLNLIGPGVKALQLGDEEAFVSFAGGLMMNEALADQLEYFTQIFRKTTAIKRAGDEGFTELVRIYDIHYMGNLFELVQWLAFCFEVNHASFLGGAGVSLQSVGVLLKDALNSRYRKAAAKPGRSGASSSPDVSTKATPTS